MVIFRINSIFYIISPSYIFRLPLFAPSSGWNIIYLICCYIKFGNMLVNCKISHWYLRYCNWNNVQNINIMCVKILSANYVWFNKIWKYWILKLRLLAWYSGLECFPIIYCSKCSVTAVVYLASEYALLSLGWVSVFIVVSLVKISYWGGWHWYLHLCNKIVF